MSQMEFKDVTEMEHIPGDPEYTRWLEAQRPEIKDSSGRRVVEGPVLTSEQ